MRVPTPYVGITGRIDPKRRQFQVMAMLKLADGRSIKASDVKQWIN